MTRPFRVVTGLRPAAACRSPTAKRRPGGPRLTTGDDAISPAALTLAVVTATRSSVGLAVILVCGMLPRVALLPFGGVVVDRAGARRVALASDVVSGLAQLAIGLLLLTRHLAIAPVAAAAAVGGAAAAFGVPATLPLVAGTADAGGRLAANSLLGVANSATGVAGPAIAGALIFTVGGGWAFVLDAASFAVSAGTRAVIRVRPMEVPRQPLRRELVAGWAEVRARTWYWSSIIGHCTCNFALGMLMTTGPLIAVTELGGKGVWPRRAGGVGRWVPGGSPHRRAGQGPPRSPRC